MGHGIFRAVAGSLAQTRKMDVLANNVAHADTPGFKSDRIRFEEALHKAERAENFVDTPESVPQLTQGSLRRTDNPLDVAIAGDGFFVVQQNGEQRLTRDGRFLVGPSGTLRTTTGLPVMGQSGQIQLPPPGVPGVNQVTIDPNGMVRAGDLLIDQIKTVSADAKDVRKVDQQLFSIEDPNVLRPATGQVLQGHVEEANVNPVQAMTEMVRVQRSFEALQQAVRTYREIDGASHRRLR